MRIIFMGTPAFAVPSLAGLLANGHDIVAVYSQPPRQSGRGHKTQKGPVHQFAEDQGLEVRTPTSFKDPVDRAAFADLEADVAIVVAYGLILPKSILEATALGCLNVHGSLLPRWRGAAPIQRAIMAGDTQTGVQVMQMEKGLDTGPVLLSETVPIHPGDTAGSLGHRLAHIGADLLPRTLAALSRGGLVPQPQSDDGVTYAHKISAEDAKIDWTKSAASVDCHIRGLNPVPGAWTTLEKDEGTDRLKIWMSRCDDTPTDAPPGTVLGTDGDDGVRIACGDGRTVVITRLQRPGKAAQDVATFLLGYDLPSGARLT